MEVGQQASAGRDCLFRLAQPFDGVVPGEVVGGALVRVVQVLGLPMVGPGLVQGVQGPDV